MQSTVKVAFSYRELKKFMVKTNIFLKDGKASSQVNYNSSHDASPTAARRLTCSRCKHLSQPPPARALASSPSHTADRDVWFPLLPDLLLLRLLDNKTTREDPSWARTTGFVFLKKRLSSSDYGCWYTSKFFKKLLRM